MANSIPSVYLDVCALNRPFDDQSQIRIQLETAAIHLILANVRSRALQLLVSPVHQIEVDAIPDITRRTSLQTLIRETGIQIHTEAPVARKRAIQLHRQGMGIADAAHIAYCESSGADFVTVDDRLLRQCRRIGISVWAGTPSGFCEKESLR